MQLQSGSHALLPFFAARMERHLPWLCVSHAAEPVGGRMRAGSAAQARHASQAHCVLLLALRGIGNLARAVVSFTISWLRK